MKRKNFIQGIFCMGAAPFALPVTSGVKKSTTLERITGRLNGGIMRIEDKRHREIASLQFSRPAFSRPKNRRAVANDIRADMNCFSGVIDHVHLCDKFGKSVIGISFEKLNLSSRCVGMGDGLAVSSFSLCKGNIK